MHEHLVAQRIDEVRERLAALEALGPKLPQPDAEMLAAAVADLQTALSAREIAELELHRQRLQALEAMRRLAGRIAHELHNSLVVIATSSEILAHDLPTDNPLHLLGRSIADAAGQAAVLIEQLQAFAGQQPASLRLVDLNQTVAEISRPIKSMIGEDIELVMRPGEDAGRIHADPVQIEEVLLNLVSNARTAMLEGGQLTIGTEALERGPEEGEVNPGRFVVLSVSDTGCGMTPEVRSHALEPFFTTKEPQRSAGLGLSVVSGIVKQLGGHIELESQPGRGTIVKVLFPRAAETTRATTTSEDTLLSMEASSDTIFLSPKDVPVSPVAAAPPAQSSETAR